MNAKSATASSRHVDTDVEFLPESHLLQRRMGGLGGLGGTQPIANPFLVEPHLIEELREFAESKGLIVVASGWEIKALILAAAEHLGAGKSGRGRPSKKTTRSELLALLGIYEGMDGAVLELISQIDADDEARINEGLRPKSDRYWATLEAKKTSEEGSSVFEQNRSKWQKRISAARVTFHRPKRKM